jgi:hypothetical protein
VDIKDRLACIPGMTVVRVRAAARGAQGRSEEKGEVNGKGL